MRPASRFNNDSPLAKRLWKDLQPIVDRGLADTNKPTHETAQESYAYEVFWRSASLVEMLNALHEIIFYIERFPATRVYRESGPTKPDWYRYHIENFHVRLKGVFDRALNLVGTVIGWDEGGERPSIKKLSRHELLTGSETITHLSALGNVVRESRELRNMIVHENSYSDRDLRQLSALTLALHHKLEMSSDPGEVLKWKTKWYVRDLVPSLKSKVQLVETYCEGLFSQVLELYERLSPYVTKAD